MPSSSDVGVSETSTGLFSYVSPTTGLFLAAGLGVVGTLMLVSVMQWVTTEAVDRPVTRMTVTFPADQLVVRGPASAAVVVSPDGSRLVYAAQSQGRTQLYVRELEAFSATALWRWSASSRPECGIAYVLIDLVLKEVAVQRGELPATLV